MSKYVLRVLTGQANTAGQKAKEDIEYILKNIDFKPINIILKKNKILRILFSRKEVNNKLEKLKEGDSFVIQYPMYSRITSRMILNKCKKKKIKTIGFIHDVESLRLFKNNRDKVKSELTILNKFSVLIVHNKKMEAWLKQNGIEAPMISLEIFDYINNQELPNVTKKMPLVLAGNLAKAQFLENWSLKKEINVFGIMPSEHYPQNVNYKGVKSPNELPKFLSGSFGLVWDGNSLKTNAGKYGDYTRYNNPHKVSLYLSCGLPVIVWKEAAISNFITNNNLGISITSLQELDSVLETISDNDYLKMIQSVKKFSGGIRKGKYTIKAIDAALQN